MRVHCRLQDFRGHRVQRRRHPGGGRRRLHRGGEPLLHLLYVRVDPPLRHVHEDLVRRAGRVVHVPRVSNQNAGSLT